MSQVPFSITYGVVCLSHSHYEMKILASYQEKVRWNGAGIIVKLEVISYRFDIINYSPINTCQSKVAISDRCTL